MTPIFGRGPSLQFRLFIAVMISASLMLADSRLNAFSEIRYLLNSFVAPIHYAANLPRTMFDGMYERFNSRNTLMLENQKLKQDIFIQNSNLLLLEQLKQENSRLRDLLGSPFIRDEKKMVTEVMAVDSAPYTHQVMIDKGLIDGVYEGQPVINDKGIVGQIKRGKSSFLNSLLFDGKPVLPKAATPMTAALTKISYSEEPSATVEFYSKKEWKKVLEQAYRVEQEEISYQEQLNEFQASKVSGQRRQRGVRPPQKPNHPEESKACFELYQMVNRSGLNVDEYLDQEYVIQSTGSNQTLISDLTPFVGADGKSITTC